MILKSVTTCVVLMSGCGSGPSQVGSPAPQKCEHSPRTRVEENGGGVKHAGTQGVENPRQTDAKAWLITRFEAGGPIYSIDSGTCLEWEARVLGKSPTRVLLTNETRHIGGHIFVKKIVVTLYEPGLKVNVMAMRHWTNNATSAKWKRHSGSVSAEYQPRQPLLVDDGRAVAVFKDWWWYGTYDDCRRDLFSDSPHSFMKNDPFSEDDDSWPSDVTSLPKSE